ncbi:hypothetical protein GX411_05805 [Candidatus Fermentibacteria bacterium]|nr:hypothetical protein [Candidatus Fermentibacteria bacterium]
MRTACVPDFLSDCFLAEPAEPERGGHGPARRMPLPAEGPDGGDMADMIAATHAGIPLLPLSRAVADGETTTIFCTSAGQAEEKGWEIPVEPGAPSLAGAGVRAPDGRSGAVGVEGQGGFGESRERVLGAGMRRRAGEGLGLDSAFRKEHGRG